mgnify:FL=1
MRTIQFLTWVGCFCMLMSCTQKQQQTEEKKTSGNPVFPGWYADPEGIVFGDEYWIYPTLSLLHGEDTLIYKADVERKTDAINPDYNLQTHMDAFSSKDLVNWTKHPRVLHIDDVKWVKYALWAPSIIHANDKYYIFFGGFGCICVFTKG